MRRMLLVMALLNTVLHADETETVRTANLEFVNAWHAANLEAAKASPDLHILPRLRIDKAAATVSFYAEATGIGLKEPVEFFLIGEESGNAYEAIAVALAAPKDIATAIRMIGLPEGRSPNPAAMQFWPKGERVVMTFNGRRAEQLLLDSRTGRTLPANGFVYTGSKWITADNGDAAAQLAAQVRPPYAIAANYNEPDALLDVPWQAPQTAVYTHQVQNPDFRLNAGERVLVTISPEYRDGKRRVQEMQLILQSADIATIADAQFTLKSAAAEEELLNKGTLDQLLAVFAGMVDEGFDPFVEIRIQPEVPLGIVRQTATILKSIDTEKGIRIEPPPEGELYYQAFTPNEEFRERQNRYIHPWELHLESGDEAVLTRIDEHWTRGEPKPEITTEAFPAATPEALLQVLTEQNPDVRGIYVFAPPSLTYGSLMRFVRPALKTHPHIHVYLQAP